MSQNLVRVGSYCWRCHNVNNAPCRSDAVPIYVPIDWEKEMRDELDKREAGEFDTDNPHEAEQRQERLETYLNDCERLKMNTVFIHTVKRILAGEEV